MAERIRDGFGPAEEQKRGDIHQFPIVVVPTSLGYVQQSVVPQPQPPFQQNVRTFMNRLVPTPFVFPSPFMTPTAAAQAPTAPSAMPMAAWPHPMRFSGHAWPQGVFQAMQPMYAQAAQQAQPMVMTAGPPPPRPPSPGSSSSDASVNAGGDDAGEDGDDSWVCQYKGCGKVLKTKFCLRRHQKRHTDGKPHACDQCSRRFPDLTSMKRHMRVHTGEKPYRCRWSTCARRFADGSNAKRHENTHFPDRRRFFRCSPTDAACGASIENKTAFIRHLHDQHSIGDQHPQFGRLCARLYALGGPDHEYLDMSVRNLSRKATSTPSPADTMPSPLSGTSRTAAAAATAAAACSAAAESSNTTRASGVPAAVDARSPLDSVIAAAFADAEE